MATSYGDAAAANRNPLVQMIPTDYDKRTPMPDGSQNNPMNSELGRNVTKTLNAIPGAAAVPGSAARAGGLMAKAFGAAVPALPYAPAAGLATAIGVGQSTAAPVAAPASPTPAPNFNDYSSQPQGMAGPPEPPSPATASASPPRSDVKREGDSYSGSNISGDITVNGKAPGGQFTEGQAGSLVQRALQQQTAPQVPQFSAPQAAHSGNDWEARNNLRNLEVSASSITNNGGAFDSRRGRISGPSAAQSAFQDAQRADLAARGAQPGLDAATNQVNSNLQREGMQQQGSNGRSLVQAMLEQQKINQAGEAQGYTNRAAGLVERMRNQVADETDPTKRRSLVDTMMAMEGKQTQADPYLVVPGGQQVDALSGRAYNTPSAVFNRQTGQWVQQPGQASNLPAGMTKQVGTSGGKPVYEDASGNRFVAG